MLGQVDITPDTVGLISMVRLAEPTLEPTLSSQGELMERAIRLLRERLRSEAASAALTGLSADNSNTPVRVANAVIARQLVDDAIQL
jgi:hypothetical protein